MLLLKLPASNAALKTLRIHSKYTHSGNYAAAHTAACNAALKMSRAHRKYTHSGNYAAAHTAASNAVLKALRAQQIHSTLANLSIPGTYCLVLLSTLIRSRFQV
jgi:hypothetical protein